MNRKIILNIAISLDGYIADEQGGYLWIVGHGDHSQDTTPNFEFGDFLETVDVLVMGRKAFEDCGTKGYETKQIIVATTQDNEDYENVNFVKENICDYIKALREQEGKDIWLFGGGILADEFIKENCIDKYIIGIIPVILGKGKPLFYPENPTVELDLEKCTVNDGIVIMQYQKRGHHGI